MGEFFKGIGNKLYRVLQLSVQKHFINFFFFLDSKLVQPHTAAASDSEKSKNKECSKYVFSLCLSSEICF